MLAGISEIAESPKRHRDRGLHRALAEQTCRLHHLQQGIGGRETGRPECDSYY